MTTIRAYIGIGEGADSAIYEVTVEDLNGYSPDVANDVMNRCLELAQAGVEWMRTDDDVTGE